MTASNAHQDHSQEHDQSYRHNFSERLLGFLVMIFAAGGLGLIIYGALANVHGCVVPGFELVGIAIVILTTYEIQQAGQSELALNALQVEPDHTA